MNFNIRRLSPDYHGVTITIDGATIDLGLLSLAERKNLADTLRDAAYELAQVEPLEMELLEALQAIEGAYVCGADLNIVMDQVRTVLARAKEQS